MSAEHHAAEHHSAEHHDDHVSMTKKKIWSVFWVLLGITAIEFFIALVMIPQGMIGQGLGNVIYIALTILKAFYIVAYFMHLKFEKFALIYSIIVPLVFIIFFIIWMLYEGNFWMNIRN
jgi:caa(3)-type oxidase subunit IV